MTLRLLAFATLIAYCWYATVIETASVAKSDEFAELLQRIVHEGKQNHRTQRATDESADTVTKRICDETMPCGWSVYTPFTRNVDYYMKNECDCPNTSYKCVRAEDCLMVSAYVYRCRQNTTADDIEAPEESN